MSRHYDRQATPNVHSNTFTHTYHGQMPGGLSFFTALVKFVISVIYGDHLACILLTILTEVTLRQ